MANCCQCQIEVDEHKLLLELDSLMDNYVNKEGALIPVLQIAQGLFGYLPREAMQLIGKRLNKPYSEVSGVVTFYSLFSTVPQGKYVVRVCLGTACYVRGGKEVLEGFKKELGIDVGQTTADRLFSLEVGRCFGACGIAPVVMINDNTHQRVKSNKIAKILNSYRQLEDTKLEGAE